MGAHAMTHILSRFPLGRCYIFGVCSVGYLNAFLCLHVNFLWFWWWFHMPSSKLANVMWSYPTVMSPAAYTIFNVVWINISFPERNIYKEVTGVKSSGAVVDMKRCSRVKGWWGREEWRVRKSWSFSGSLLFSTQSVKTVLAVQSAW